VKIPAGARVVDLSRATVLPGLIAMSALIVPPMTQVKAVPAMMPFGAAAPRFTIGAAAVVLTLTVAVPDIEPTLA